MFDTNTNYWLTIEPYTYVYICNNEVVLFNTLNGALLEYSNAEIIKLLEEVLSGDNLSVSLLKGDMLNNSDIFHFVCDIRENFMGDIIDIKYSNKKPIQFISSANLLPTNLKATDEILFGNILYENLTSYLDELTLSICGSNILDDFTKQTWLYKSTSENSNDIFMSFNEIKKIGLRVRGTSISKIRVVGSNISAHPNIVEIVDFFKTLPVTVEYIQNGNCMGFLKSDFINTIIIDMKFDEFEYYEYTDKILYLFVVTSDSDLQRLEPILEKIHNYKILPYYTADNLDFFINNVFLNKEDLINIPQRLQDIYSKQFINLNNFGKFFVSVDGHVYSNLYKSSLGLIEDMTLKDLVYKELSSKDAWRNIREISPCMECLYRWLCPSPSNYEIALNKENLCNIK